MTVEELITRLQEVVADPEADAEEGHFKADRLLLGFIDNEEVTDTYDALLKWYA